MELFLEKTSNELYADTIAAFPNTTKRQFSTDTIRFVSLQWVPFRGLNTLFVNGVAKNSDGGRDHLYSEYHPSILFKNVIYHTELRPKLITLIDNRQSTHYLEQLSYDQNNILVRCGCPDYYWRFQHWNHMNRSNYGRDRKKYESDNPVNPMESPGMCKHIIKLLKVIKESGIVME